MNFKNKKILSTILFFTLILNIFLFPLNSVAFDNIVFAQGKRKINKNITIIHTNDMHGRILEEENSGMGFAKLNTKIKEIRRKNPDSILLDAGDAVQGSEIAIKSKGESIIRLMNAMKYDAMVVGNHEFDYGYKRLLELRDMADFPMISANVLNDYERRDFKPYIIKEVNGIKIGIFGITTPLTKDTTKPKNIKGLTFLNPILVSKKMVRELKNKDVDLIVGLIHAGLNANDKYSSKRIAKKVKGIDIIVDGHSHTKLDKGMTVGNTLIVQSGKHTENLGVVNVKFLGNKIASKKVRLFTKEEGTKFKEDEELKKIINEIIKENKTTRENKTKETIGKTEKTYIVEAKDTLYKIGVKYEIDWKELANFNEIKNPDKIYQGQKIKIPIK